MHLTESNSNSLIHYVFVRQQSTRVMTATQIEKAASIFATLFTQNDRYDDVMFQSEN